MSPPDDMKGVKSNGPPLLGRVYGYNYDSKLGRIVMIQPYINTLNANAKNEY